MADTKLSALSALLGTNTAADDELYIVDTSLGSSHRITRDELHAAIVSGFFASQAQAEAGTDNTKIITPLRGRQAFDSFLDGAAISEKTLRTEIGYSLLTSDAGDVTITSLGSLYSRWYIEAFGVIISASQGLVVEGRVSAGTWRTVFNASSFNAGSNDRFFLRGMIENVDDNEADNLKRFVIHAGTNAVILDRTENAQLVTSMISQGGHVHFAAEGAWDELRITVGGGGFEGSTAAAATSLQIWGQG